MNNDSRLRGEEIRQDAGSIELGDIFYVLFRRKWLVLTFALLGLLAAAALWKFKPPLYQSQAKLMVRYVVDNRSPSSLDTDPQVRTPDAGGQNVINSEVEILTSLDITREVARVLGPEKILAEAGGSNDLSAAAAVIRLGLTPDVPLRSSIITLKFAHPDPELAQAVLQQLIEVYLKKHAEIHRNVGLFDEFLTQQTDTLRSRLAQTEESLKKLKSDAGIISLEESKKAYAELSSKIRQGLLDAEAELAQRRSGLEELRKMGRTNSEPVVPITAVPQGKVDEYRKVGARVEYLERRDQEFSTTFTMENALVKTNRLQLEEARRLKEKLETENPALLRVSIMPPTSLTGGIVSMDTDLVVQASQVKAWEARVYFLSNQLAQVRAEANAVENVETRITELQRKRSQEETQFTYFERSLQQARFNDALGSGKPANISRVQAPSPPLRQYRDLFKKMAVAVMGGLALGVGLAFLIELVVNRTLKSPKDVERLLAVPLFLTIPRLRLPSSRLPAGGLIYSAGAGLEETKRSAAGSGSANGKGSAAPWDREHGLWPYHEAMRDRLLNFFEAREMAHKPKLVAITSCDEGAGVSSIATGLAAALSETGDGNVLLVDMKGQRESAHAFSQGKPVCSLADALENDSRGGALVQQNLYVVSANNPGDKLQRVLPRKFSHFMPKLKASDYDYIIFDMPPVSQTSITGKLARYMDMVFMVIESEKTDREVARRAGALLAESKANVVTVFNKSRNYLPRWLHREFR